MVVAAGIGYTMSHGGCFGACRECGFFMVKLLCIEFGKWNFGQMIGLSLSQMHWPHPCPKCTGIGPIIDSITVLGFDLVKNHLFQQLLTSPISYCHRHQFITTAYWSVLVPDALASNVLASLSWVSV